MMRRYPYLFLAFLSWFLFSGPALGATIRVSVAASDRIHLEGVDLHDVAAADLTLIFDPETFQVSQIQPGDLIVGSLSANNPAAAGRLRLAFVHSRPIQGSGIIVRILGEPRGSSGVRFLGLQGVLRDSQGQALPFRVDIPPTTNPFQVTNSPGLQEESDAREPSPGAEPPEPSIPDPNDSSPFPESPPAPAPGYAGIASIAFPQDRESLPDPKKAEAEWTAEPPPGYPQEEDHISPNEEPSRQKDSDDSVPVRETEFTSFPSVLKRFHEHQGPRTMGHLSPLFEDALPSSIRQSPRIAIADGRTPVMLRIEGGKGKEAASIALAEGRLLQTGEKDGGWEIEVLPEKGSWETTVFVLDGGRLLEIPLTVAPALPAEMQEWCSLYRSEKSKNDVEMPRLDCNDDGKVDAQDDFILMVNCLGEVTAIPTKR